MQGGDVVATAPHAGAIGTKLLRDSGSVSGAGHLHIERERAMDESQPKVVHNRDASRYEVRLDEGLALAQYHREADSITFTHTEVPPGEQGQGVASALARAALDEARADGLRVVPSCGFFATYIDRHPEYADLVGGEG